MANLTVTIDDAVLKRARIRALEMSTSVNALVAEYLRSFASSAGEAEAMKRIRQRVQSVQCASGNTGRTWSRDDIYDT